MSPGEGPGERERLAMTGEVIASRYEVRDEVGRGAMGRVFRALDRNDDRFVAVKVLNEQSGEFRIDNVLRFKRETEILSRLDHKNIVKLYSFGQHQSHYYIVTQLLEGATLKAHLQATGRMEVDKAVEVVEQVAGALNYAHLRGIIHRDIKPGNIFLRREEGERLHATVLDFGLARLVSLAELFEAGTTLGTLPYMAPELTGIYQGPVDQRADLYSLGIIFYELLAGRPPFQSEDPSTLIHQHIAQAPFPPTSIDRSIPPILEAVVMKLLQKEVGERYKTAMGLVSDLREFRNVGTAEAFTERFRIASQDTPSKGLCLVERLVGRDEELANLKARYDKLRASQGGILFITGEVGIGKTRLVQELQKYARAREGIFLSGKCFGPKRAIPYGPIVEAIEPYLYHLQRPRFPGQEETLRRIRSMVRGMEGDLARVIPRLRDFLGHAAAVKGEDLGGVKRRFLDQFSSLITGIASPEHPLVLFLDDLHWGDDGTFALIRLLAPRLAGLPVLMVCAYRQDEVDEGHNLAALVDELTKKKISAPAIELRPLGEDKVRELVGEIFSIPMEKVEQFGRDNLDRMSGNPLFINELCHSLTQEGAVSFIGGNWVLDPEKVSRAAVPSELVDILMRKVKALSPEVAECLGAAAIIGHEFDFDTLVHTLGREPEKVLDLIDRGIEGKIITVSHRELRAAYAFCHDKMREALYDRIGAEDRARMHNEVGLYLERNKGEARGRSIYRLAYHFDLGGDEERAYRYTLEAGREAQAAHAHAEAAYFYEKALSLYDERGGRGTPSEWHFATEALGDTSTFLSQYTRSVGHYHNALSGYESDVDRARLLRKIGEAHFKAGETGTAVEVLERALQTLGVRTHKSRAGMWAAILYQLCVRLSRSFRSKGRGGPREAADAKTQEIVRIFERLGYFYYFFDPLRSAECHLKQINLAEVRASARDLAQAYSLHSIACVALMQNKRARHYGMKAFSLRESLDDRFEKSLAQSYLGLLYYHLGQWSSAIEKIEQSLEVMRRMGDPFEAKLATDHLGICYFAQGEFEKALRCHRALLEISGEVKDAQGMAWARMHLAKYYMYMGRLEEAGQNVDEALRVLLGVNDQLNLAIGYEIKGRIHLRRGDFPRALEALEESRAIVERRRVGNELTLGIYPSLAEAYIRAADERERISRAERARCRRLARRYGRRAMFWGRIYTNYRGQAHHVFGLVMARAGKRRPARKHFLRSIEVFQKLGAHYELGRAYLDLGRFLFEQGKEDDALEWLVRAETLFEQVGTATELEAVRSLLPRAEPEGAEGEVRDRRLFVEQRGLASILEVMRNVTTTLELDELLRRVVDSIIQLFGAENGFLLLMEEEAQTGEKRLEVKVALNVHKEAIKEEDFTFSRQVIDEVIEVRKARLIINAVEDESLRYVDSVVGHGLRSIMCVPIQVREKMIGVIYIDNRLVKDLFSEKDLELLVALASQAAISIENARAYSLVEEMNLSLEEKVRQRTRALEEAQAQLVHTEKMSSLGQLVAGVAHELNNPIGFVYANVELIREQIEKIREGKDTERAYGRLGKLLTRSKEGALRTKKIVEDLRNFSRLDEAEWKAVDLNDGLESTRELLAFRLGDRIRVHREYGEIPLVECRAGQINQVFMNILNNAVDAIEGEGDIWIRTEVIEEGESGRVAVTIQDNGPGIPAEKIGKIFDPFYTTKDVGKGTGLGLSISYGVIQRHDGRIDVEIEVGRGTTFTIELPCRRPQ